MIIGITGGTGSGKTTALKAIKLLGGYTLDCDEVYHELLSTSDEMKSAIDSRFPGVLIDGELDRKALGRQVFSSEKALSDLSNITHPFVISEVLERIDRKRADGTELFAIDAIALFESGGADICDTTVFVTAPKEVRARRIMAREGITLDYAMLRIEAQKSDDYFESKCDYTLVNDFEDEKTFCAYCTDFFNKIIRRD
jgi:dephospho-CoA kinase